MKFSFQILLPMVLALFLTACSSTIYQYADQNNFQGVVTASKTEHIDSKGSYGFTALHNASDNGNVRMVEFLLSKGANIEARTNGGDTPLIRAAYKGHLGVVKLLVSKGANLNAESNAGVTPLTTASGHGRLAIVKVLVEAGADIRYKTVKNNDTALAAAIRNHKTHVTAYYNKKLNKDKKQKEQKLALEKQKKEEQSHIKKVETFLAKNDFEGLKSYTEQNPNAVYFIKDQTIRLMLTGPKGLKVGDIRKQVKKGRSEKIILALIKRVKEPYKEFDLDEIDLLVNMGLSDNIIASMIEVTTEILKDEQQKKEQEFYLAEQKRIAQESQLVKERVVERQVVQPTNQNGGNDFVNAVGKEVGKELGKRLLESLF